LSRNFLTREEAYGGPTVFPALNVFEDKNILTVKAELPGVKAEHLDISFESDTLTIKGRREPYHNGEKVSYHRREIETGSFSRALTMPIKVAPDSITARLQDGILVITMEKAADVKPRQITVKTE